MMWSQSCIDLIPAWRGRVCNICTTFLELTDTRMDCMSIFVVDLGVAYEAIQALRAGAVGVAA